MADSINISLGPAIVTAQPSSDVEPDLKEDLAISLSKTTDAVVAIDNPRAIDNRKKDLLRNTTFQARLGRRLDRIQRECSDNVIRLSSHPTDMLRIRIKRDDITRDIISRSVVSSEIMPIILPPMEKIPLRHLQGYRDNSEATIPSLYTISQQEYFEIYAPTQSKLEPDDLLVRMIYDDVNCPDDPYVLILQVSEQLATIGYSSIRWMTYWATIYNEKLPQQIIEIIKKAEKKRELLHW